MIDNDAAEPLNEETVDDTADGQRGHAFHDSDHLRALESQDASLTPLLAEIVTKAAQRLEGKNKQ